MELLESQDPEKKKLIETSDRHKKALEKEVTAITQKTDKMLTNALIIGGSLALTYFVISSLSSRKKKKRKSKLVKAQIAAGEEVEEENEEEEGPSVLGQLGTKVLNEASVILLDIAKEKLFEYLESRKKADENS
jgi:Pyruvate/2-oxoacid:ferredoxin oxidoreductase gamma subunit